MLEQRWCINGRIQAQELTEDEMLDAVKFGFDAFQPVITAINELKEKVGNTAWTISERSDEYKSLESDLERFADQITETLKISSKLERYAAMDAIKLMHVHQLLMRLNYNWHGLVKSLM